MEQHIQLVLMNSAIVPFITTQIYNFSFLICSLSALGEYKNNY